MAGRWLCYCVTVFVTTKKIISLFSQTVEQTIWVWKLGNIYEQN